MSPNFLENGQQPRAKYLRRLRILQILEATIGGTKRHLLDLCSGLDAMKFDIHLACPLVRSESLDDTSFVSDMETLDIPVHLIPMVRKINPVSDARAVIALMRLIHRGQFDIVHTHSSKAGFLGRFAAAIDSKARVVYSPHGFYYLNFDDPIRFTLFKFVERLHKSRTHRMITLSTGEYRHAVEDRIMDPKRTTLVENGIDHEIYLSRAEARATLNLPQDGVVIGTISRLTPQKAPFDLLAMVRELRADNPNLLFAWLSDGEMRPQVEAEIARYDLENHVRLFGYVDQARRLLPALDVFVLASKWEGLPYTIMEAMDAGVPIVATDVVGTQDVIDPSRTGYLVPPERPQELAKMVNRLLIHPNHAANIARAAQEEVATRFSRMEMVRKISSLYTELAGNKGRD